MNNLYKNISYIGEVDLEKFLFSKLRNIYLQGLTRARYILPFSFSLDIFVYRISVYFARRARKKELIVPIFLENSSFLNKKKSFIIKNFDNNRDSEVIVEATCTSYIIYITVTLN